MVLSTTEDNIVNIHCKDETQLVILCCQLVKQGFQFEADAEKLVIKLTGGY